MKLLFLGVSSALAIGEKQFQSNMLIETKSKRRMLIDCGTDIRHSLYDQGYNYTNIDAIYVSHLHADHVGGLEWFGFSKFFMDKKKPALYISQDQRDRLWNNVLSGGMTCLEDGHATLCTYFDVMPIEDLCFTWEDHSFQLIKIRHSYNHHELLPSYGLLIKGDEKTVFISTDLRFCPDLIGHVYNSADIIFHDCELLKTASGQHPRYSELKTLDSLIKEKTWLYGYNNTQLPDAQRDGFKGFVIRGQSFEF